MSSDGFNWSWLTPSYTEKMSQYQKTRLDHYLFSCDNIYDYKNYSLLPSKKFKCEGFHILTYTCCGVYVSECDDVPPCEYDPCVGNTCTAEAYAVCR